MSKFGFYTDCHLTNRHVRVDDIRDSILNKLSEIYRYAKQNDFDFMLFGGDFFHTQKVLDLKIFVTVCEIMKQFGKPTYFIVGNHDVYGNSLNYYKQSSLNFIATLIPQYFIPLFDNVQLKDVVLYGCHSYNDLQYTINNIQRRQDKLQILLDHHMIYDKSIPNAKVVTPKQVGQNNLDLILTGHVHMGYQMQKIGRTVYYNPGSLTRMSADAKDMKVKMAVINNNCKQFSIQQYFPKILDGNVIFKQNVFSGVEKIAKLQQNNESADLIQSLKHFQTLKASSSSIFQLLNKIAVEQNIEKDVVSYINKFEIKQLF